MACDEENRLMALSDNDKTSRYTYNATGERVVKSHGYLEGMYVNGAPQGLTSDCVNFRLRFGKTSKLLFLSACTEVPRDGGLHHLPRTHTQRFTKHYFIGDRRVASKIGAGIFQNAYGHGANVVTAGQKDYQMRMMQIEKQREDIFFYHTDHLGSTSYITDAKANIAQFGAYLPYGELLVDEHSSTEEMPYKFNGKEFDQETGLYYYGARYMNPVTSLWYGVAPLAEKYPSVSSLIYCFDNPIKYIDPDGRKTQYATLEEIVTYGKKNSSTFFSLMKLANINMSNFSKEISFGDETSTTSSTRRICLTKSTDIKRQIIKLTHEFTNRINRLRLQKATEDVKEGIITPKKYAEELIRIEFEGQINHIKVASEIDYRYPKNEDGGTNRLIDRYSIDKSIKLREELESSKELKQFYIKQGDALRNETRRNQRHKQQFKRR